MYLILWLVNLINKRMFLVLWLVPHYFFLLSFPPCANRIAFVAQMMMKRHKMENDLGIGTEVGHSKNAETAKRSPALAAMNRKFGMIHGLSSLADILSFGSLAMHSWYLSSKLDL